MKNDVKRMSQLIQKLEKEGDIFLEEADWIYSLVSKKPDVFNFDSPAYNKELYTATELWYKTISKKIKAGQHGNFIFTIIHNKDKDQKINKLTLPAWKAIKKYGNPEDLYNIVVIDEKIYSALPYQYMFDEIRYHEELKSIYKIKTPRAGLYRYPIKVGHLTYTIGELINDQLAPVVTIPLTNSPDRALYREVFKVATGARDITQDPYFGKKEIELFTLAAFIKNKGISCVATTDVHKNHFAVFVERGRARIVKEALDVPFEEMVKNAVQENVIDKKIAKTLLDSEYIAEFPTIDFVNASVKYLDNVVETKLQREITRKIVEEEDGWLEETR